MVVLTCFCVDEEILSSISGILDSVYYGNRCSEALKLRIAVVDIIQSHAHWNVITETVGIITKRVPGLVTSAIIDNSIEANLDKKNKLFFDAYLGIVVRE